MLKTISSSNSNVVQNTDNTFIEKGKKLTIRKVGKVVSDINSHVIDDYYKSMLRYCHPRPLKIIEDEERIRTPWTFPISIWAQYDYKYEGESEDYIKQVFEHDFGRCNVMKDAKTEQVFLEIKELLWTNYKKMYFMFIF